MNKRSHPRHRSKNLFDLLAPTYDTDFTGSPIARVLRRRVHARLDRYAQHGDRVLELGCGTGEDALHLARRGVHILATDSSTAMLAAARTKLARYPDSAVAHLDLQALGSYLAPQSSWRVPAFSAQRFVNAEPGTQNPVRFALAFANFGVLNCLAEWQPLAAWLSDCIAPGGVAAFGVMSPLCLWEIGWHGLHGEWNVALRRLRRGGAAFTVGSEAGARPRHPQHIHYPSVRRLTRAFAPWFRRVHVEPLGLLLPPSDAYGVIERRRHLLRLLLALDARIGRAGALALLADHYWIEFERR